jgi:hypothetical protein
VTAEWSTTTSTDGRDLIKGMDLMLPREFTDLEPFAESWRLDTEARWYAKRPACSIDEMQAWHDPVPPRAEAAIAHRMVERRP